MNTRVPPPEELITGVTTKEPDTVGGTRTLANGKKGLAFLEEEQNPGAPSTQAILDRIKQSKPAAEVSLPNKERPSVSSVTTPTKVMTSQPDVQKVNVDDFADRIVEKIYSAIPYDKRPSADVRERDTKVLKPAAANAIRELAEHTDTGYIFHGSSATAQASMIITKMKANSEAFDIVSKMTKSPEKDMDWVWTEAPSASDTVSKTKDRVKDSPWDAAEKDLRVVLELDVAKAAINEMAPKGVKDVALIESFRAISESLNKTVDDTVQAYRKTEKYEEYKDSLQKAVQQALTGLLADKQTREKFLNGSPGRKAELIAEHMKYSTNPTNEMHQPLILVRKLMGHDEGLLWHNVEKSITDALAKVDEQSKLAAAKGTPPAPVAGASAEAKPAAVKTNTPEEQALAKQGAAQKDPNARQTRSDASNALTQIAKTDGKEVGIPSSSGTNVGSELKKSGPIASI